MTKPRDRSCVLCVHIHLDQAESGYSEYTPSTDGCLECRKSHWYISMSSNTTEDLRKALLTARTCPDFKEVQID